MSEYGIAQRQKTSELRRGGGTNPQQPMEKES